MSPAKDLWKSIRKEALLLSIALVYIPAIHYLAPDGFREP